MKELISRINSSGTVEIAYVEDGGQPQFKKISQGDYIAVVNQTMKSMIRHSKDLKLLHPQIIAISSNYVVIKQPGEKKIVSYNPNELGEMKTYKISFPNSIYIVEFEYAKIRTIECYAYKEYAGENTDLYEYPMPNELAGNEMCMGNADRTIVEDDYVAALNKIVAVPYSHSTFSGLNGFSNTVKYFEYLEKNEFPYKLLKSLNKKLKDVLKGD